MVNLNNILKVLSVLFLVYMLLSGISGLRNISFQSCVAYDSLNKVCIVDLFNLPTYKDIN